MAGGWDSSSCHSDGLRRGTSDIYLDGWEIEVASGSFCVSTDAALSVAAGSVLLFCKSGSAIDGQTCDYTYGSNAFVDFDSGATCSAEDASFALAVNDTIGIRSSSAGTTIDGVAYLASWPYAASTSMELSTTIANQTSAQNDTSTNWCAGTSSYGLLHYGTPGASNDCP